MLLTTVASIASKKYPHKPTHLYAFGNAQTQLECNQNTVDKAHRMTKNMVCTTNIFWITHAMAMYTFVQQIKGVGAFPVINLVIKYSDSVH